MIKLRQRITKISNDFRVQSPSSDTEASEMQDCKPELGRSLSDVSLDEPRVPQETESEGESPISPQQSIETLPAEITKRKQNNNDSSNSPVQSAPPLVDVSLNQKSNNIPSTEDKVPQPSHSFSFSRFRTNLHYIITALLLSVVCFYHMKFITNLENVPVDGSFKNNQGHSFPRKNAEHKAINNDGGSSTFTPPNQSTLCQVSKDSQFITVVGRTGDGKSTFGNLLMKFLGYQGPESFSEDSSPQSHTASPKCIEWMNIAVGDTPGLVDTAGPARDEENIRKITKMMKDVGFAHGILLVVNEKTPRFDFALQDGLKLMLDSFGSIILKQLAVVFTRSSLGKTPKEMREFVNEMRKLISDRTGVAEDLIPLPFYQIDSHPDKTLQEELGIEDLTGSELVLEKKNAKNRQSLEELRRWIESNKKMDLSNVEAKEYGTTKKIKDLQEEVDNGIDPSKTKVETKTEKVKSEFRRNDRYGPRQYRAAGPKKYHDEWNEVTYDVYSRTVYFKKNGEKHSESDWMKSHSFTQEEGRKTITHF